MIEPAVRDRPGAVLVDVVVKPDASRSELRGWDPWRKAVSVAVAAPAQGGRANAELSRFLADRLGVPVSKVHLVGGLTSRRKTVAVVGGSKDAIIEALEREGA